jgi:hypothetical protein
MKSCFPSQTTQTARNFMDLKAVVIPLSHRSFFESFANPFCMKFMMSVILLYFGSESKDRQKVGFQHGFQHGFFDTSFRYKKTSYNIKTLLFCPLSCFIFTLSLVRNLKQEQEQELSIISQIVFTFPRMKYGKY